MSLTPEKPVHKSNLKIDWASHDAAVYACTHWHYSRVVPVGKLVKIGVWEENKFIGVVLFGRGANNNMLTPYDLKADEGCELVRIALRKHTTPVSRIMSIALKFLKKSNPKLKLVVSYADEDQGHHGGIYQASNWIYTGLKNAGSMGAFVINGKKTHPKSVHSKGVKQSLEAVRKHLDPKATIHYTKGKHCYLMPLNEHMRSKVKALAKPYPKRTKGQALDDQSSLGGSTPTCALQNHG